MFLEYAVMTIDDYDEVLALWQASDGVGIDLCDADSLFGFAAFLQRNPGMSFVARADGRVIGAVLCGHDGRRGYLHHLAVAESFRGQGIGTVLVNQCLQVLAAEGIARCNIFVFTDNDAGLRFWESTGWKSRQDLKIMQKVVRRPPVQAYGQSEPGNPDLDKSLLAVNG